MNEVALISFSDLQHMAGTMSRSGMFNKTPDQMLALMLIAQAESLHPAIAAMEYDVIQGRPALKGQAALARFQQAGGSIKWLIKTDAEAKAVFSHPKGGELTVSWTLDRARKMGLDGKDNWRKQPGVMLSWRCVAEGVRAVYPACLNRMYLAEEVQDFEPLRDVTPSTEPVVIETHPAPAETTDWAKRAAELTAEAGYDAKQKATLWKQEGCNAEAYCKALEAIIANQKAEAAAEGDGDDFQLDSSPSIDEIMIDLEQYAASETTPKAARDDIAKAFAAKITDVGELTALLKKVKEACKA